MEKYKGRKLSKGTIIVPPEGGEEFREVFRKFDVPVIEKVVVEV